MALWLFARVAALFNNRRRALDLQILWPACVENASDLDHAKAAFAFHAFNDPAWMSLGEEEVKRRIDKLTPPPQTKEP